MIRALAFGGLAAAAAVFAPAPAAAAPLTFDTTITQMCIGSNGCGVMGQSFAPGLRFEFGPSSVSTTFTSTTTQLLGSFRASCTSADPCPTISLPDFLNLHITIRQTAPFFAVETLVAIPISGTIGPGGFIQMDFGSGRTASFTSGGQTILYETPTGIIPVFGFDLTQVFFNVTERAEPGAVPVPGTLVLLASGLALVALRRRDA